MAKYIMVCYTNRPTITLICGLSVTKDEFIIRPILYFEQSATTFMKFTSDLDVPLIYVSPGFVF